MHFERRLLLLASPSETPMKSLAAPRVQSFESTWILARKRAPLNDRIEVGRFFEADSVVAPRGTEKIRLDTRLNERTTPSHKVVRRLNRILAASLLAIADVSSSMAEVPDQARAAIDRIIGGIGTYVTDEGVYKVALPREVATIVLDYQTSLSPNIGLNSCVAFTPAVHHEALLTASFFSLTNCDMHPMFE